MIQKNHNEEFEVDIKFRQEITEEDFNRYDIVHFHRQIPGQKDSLDMIEGFKSAGCVTIADIDDYWVPPHGHPLRQMAINKKLPEIILNNLKAADYVTTTTEAFAKYIRERGIKCKVIPNAIDQNMAMWKSEKKESDVVRVGWIGGSSHEKDLAKLNGTFNKLYADPELKGKFQIVLCGYDVRGTITEVHPVTKEEKVRKIKPEESIWKKFEEIFNNGGNYPDGGYVRRNTLPINRYGEHYNYVDICLAPLTENIFNECKSELKIIESGMKKTALIASDVYIYHDLIKHGETGMLVPAKKDHKLWFKYIKELILNDELRTKLQENIYNFVNPDYNLDVVTAMRCDWYKEVLKNET